MLFSSYTTPAMALSLTGSQKEQTRDWGEGGWELTPWAKLRVSCFEVIFSHVWSKWQKTNSLIPSHSTPLISWHLLHFSPVSDSNGRSLVPRLHGSESQVSTLKLGKATITKEAISCFRKYILKLLICLHINPFFMYHRTMLQASFQILPILTYSHFLQEVRLSKPCWSLSSITIAL